MGQILHKHARTTEETRRDIQNSQESLIKLSVRYGVNPKTIHKWKKRDFTHDTKMGPKKIKFPVLCEGEEEAIVAFRKMTGLPLDDVLYRLQETIPHLSRSSLHRCLKRHGRSVLPKNTSLLSLIKRSSNPIL